MDNKNYFFIVSGIISVSLFTFFLTLFIFMLFSSDKNKIYALTKDNYIAVSIELPTSNLQKVKQSSDLTLNTVPEAKEVDIGDLFSDVWTKDIKSIVKKEQPLDNKRFQDIQKRLKTVEKTSSKSALNKLDDLQTEDKDNESSTSSSGDEVNEYFAKIQALVYEHFYPPQNSEGYSVKAVIELSAFGKVLDFRILNYSTNEALNDECDKVRSKLIGVLFPVNPENKSGQYIIILKSKG